MAKFCTRCGNQMPDNANVCSNCGTPLSAPVQYQQKSSFSFNDFSDKLLGLINIVAIVFLLIGAAGFLYDFIMGIVDAAEYDSLRSFLAGFAGAIATAAKYTFYSLVLSIGSKLIKK